MLLAVLALEFLFKSLARKGMGLVKYLEVWHWCSMKGLGLRMLGLWFGLGGNIDLCLSDLLHLMAKLEQS